MTQGEESDGTPTAPGAEGEEDPDKDAGATATDNAQSPQNAVLNAGALSQPTSSPEHMSSGRAPNDRTELDDEAEAPIDSGHEPVPDESTLLGKIGIEEEIIAELARAEAKMSDPTAPDDPDAAGAQV